MLFCFAIMFSRTSYTAVYFSELYLIEDRDDDCLYSNPAVAVAAAASALAGGTGGSVTGGYLELVLDKEGAPTMDGAGGGFGAAMGLPQSSELPSATWQPGTDLQPQQQRQEVKPPPLSSSSSSSSVRTHPSSSFSSSLGLDLSDSTTCGSDYPYCFSAEGECRKLNDYPWHNEGMEHIHLQEYMSW